MRFRTAATAMLALAGIGLWLGWPSPPPAPSAPPPESHAVAERAGRGVAGTSIPAPERSVAAGPVHATGVEPSPKPRSGPEQVPPWEARLRVVDHHFAPVPDAEIRLFAQWNGRHGWIHEPDPRVQLTTDAEGRATARLDLAWYCAVASKEGLGRSGDYDVVPAPGAREATLVLGTEVVLHGLVLRSDGLPARGARVSGGGGGSIFQYGRTPPVDPAVTDEAGRFAIALQRHVPYNLTAEHDGRRAYAHALVVDDHPPELVIAFPGAIGVRGFVFDPDGRPVPDASVTAWREWSDAAPDPLDHEKTGSRTGADGSFEFPVQRHARYQLVARAPGYVNSYLVWVETTPTRPYVEARLQLLRPVAIRGRVVHEDGAPFPGVRIEAVAEPGEAGGFEATRRDRFGVVPSATTDDDGGFAFAVHPATTWRLTVRLDAHERNLRTAREGVEPGSVDVVITASDAACTGCIVRGTVVRAVDGEPYEGFGLRLAADGLVQKLEARVTGNRFELPPISPGLTCAILVTPGEDLHPSSRGPLAGAVLGPFVVQAPGREFAAVLEPWGEVTVRVVDAAGTPVHHVYVSIRRTGVPGGGYGGKVDSDGTVAVRCWPGANKLSVLAPQGILHRQEVTVLPGPNPDIVVRLPAVGKRGR